MYSKIDILRFFEEYYGFSIEIPEIKKEILTESDISELFLEFVKINDDQGVNEPFYPSISKIVYITFDVWLEENNINQAPETTNLKK